MAADQCSTSREIELDFIRGVAVLLVLIFHYRRLNLLITSPRLSQIENFGWAGVDVFFVLSGFLVGGLMMREWKRTGSVDPFRFLKRRAFKIWPAYYVFLAIVAIIHVRPFRSFFWQNFFNVQNYIPSTLSHTWSLAVEEHFYLALAALAFLWSRFRWTPRSLLAFCFTLALCVEALRAWLLLRGHAVYFYTHTRIDALLLGVSLAALRTFSPPHFARLQRLRPVLIGVLAIALWRLLIDTTANLSPDANTSPWLITFVDYGALALFLLLYRPDLRPAAGRNAVYRFIARIGVYSYGIYLWHVSVERPVDWAAAHVPHIFTRITSTFLPYLLAIPLGILSTKLIELPFLRLRERIVPPRTPEPQIPPEHPYPTTA